MMCRAALEFGCLILANVEEADRPAHMELAVMNSDATGWQISQRVEDWPWQIGTNRFGP
jgi:hypothetical protein